MAVVEIRNKCLSEWIGVIQQNSCPDHSSPLNEVIQTNPGALISINSGVNVWITH